MFNTIKAKLVLFSFLGFLAVGFSVPSPTSKLSQAVAGLAGQVDLLQREMGGFRTN